MRLQAINPLDYPGWDESLLSHPGSSIFHSTGWARVLVDSYGFTPQYFAGVENGKLVAAIPVMEIRNFVRGDRGVSLPFADHCDPIYPDTAGLEDIVRQMSDHGRKRGWKTLELRVRGDLPERMSPHHCYLHHAMGLDRDENRMISLFRTNTRRNIQKAGKEGVEVLVSSTMDSLERYYRLHSMTRRDHGLPPPPLSFFRNVHRNILAAGGGIVVLASRGGREIAGAVYLNWGDRAYFKYGASDREFLQFRANHLVMWEPIRWYARRGFNSLSFGRTDTENEGLRQYKLGWGSREDTIKKVVYDFGKNACVLKRNLVYGLHNRFFREMPLAVSRSIGGMLYKYMD